MLNKQSIFNLIKRTALRFTPVEHAGLIACGFDVTKLYYRLGDLNIYVAREKYFYHNPKGKRRRLRNMLQISNLVFGETEYLHVG